jgi:hypothetical protein
MRAMTRLSPTSAMCMHGAPHGTRRVRERSATPLLENARTTSRSVNDPRAAREVGIDLT